MYTDLKFVYIFLAQNKADNINYLLCGEVFKYVAFNRASVLDIFWRQMHYW